MSNLYSNILEHHDSYLDMPKLTQVNICSNVLEKYDCDTHNVRGQKYNNKLVDNIDFLVFNIAKYKKLLYTGNEEEIKKYAHLIMFDCDKQELEELSKYDEFVKEVSELVKKYNEDDNFYSFLTDEESKQKLVKSQIEGARISERQKTNIETAQKMLKKRYPLKDIVEMTGLSREYLQTLHV